MFPLKGNLSWLLVTMLGFILLFAARPAAIGALATPPFQEIYDLLKTNLAGITAPQLEQAAVAGLIDQLSPKVSLAEGKGEADSQTNGPIVPRAAVFDNHYGYLRVSQFTDDTGKSFIKSYRDLSSTNRLKGLVIDLRYSQGQDYGQAAAMADWFFTKSAPLVDWGEGAKKSSAKTNALELPLTILVNRKTIGAAEAFAAILHDAQIGVIIGTNTAGAAAIAKEFTLSTGQRLRVAADPIKLGSGKTFPTSGLKPDIFVEVSPEDELAWFEDAYKVVAKANARTSVGTNELASASTNRQPRRRMNEAELMRMLREGINPENETATGVRELERNKNLVGDPVLSRALDLLKGLTVVQHFKSS